MKVIDKLMSEGIHCHSPLADARFTFQRLPHLQSNGLPHSLLCHAPHDEHLSCKVMSHTKMRQTVCAKNISTVNKLIGTSTLINTWCGLTFSRSRAEMSFTFAAPNAVHYNAASVKQVLMVAMALKDSTEKIVYIRMTHGHWPWICNLLQSKLVLCLQTLIAGWCPVFLWFLWYPSFSRCLLGCPQARRCHSLRRRRRHQEVLCLLGLDHHQRRQLSSDLGWGSSCCGGPWCCCRQGCSCWCEC